MRLLGTRADAIDRAEDRERFEALLNKLGFKRPRAGIAKSLDEARHRARHRLPVLVRPSYVLGGRAMMICWTDDELDAYVGVAIDAARDEGGSQTLLIDQFLKNAIEIDVDCIADGRRAVIGGVMQHIEEAGVHSGDSTSVLPPHGLDPELIAEVEKTARALALELGVIGLMNVQLAVKDHQVYVLEVNPRASRTVPFVAKATGRPLAKIAAKLMVGKTLDELGIKDGSLPKHVAVKESVFPFAKFPGVDTILGPEMRSTGEVMGIALSVPLAFGKSLVQPVSRCPIAVAPSSAWPTTTRPRPAMRHDGSETSATASSPPAARPRPSAQARVPVERINKVAEGSPHVVDAIRDASIQLVINTTQGAKAIRDSYSIRRNALLANIPYFTTMAAGLAAVDALEVHALLQQRGAQVKSLQEWHARQAEGRAGGAAAHRRLRRLDVGTNSTAAVDYPDFAGRWRGPWPAARRARRPHLRQRGGRLVAANKLPGIAGRHLPRLLLGAPGRRARRHERPRPGRAHHRPRPRPELVRAFVAARFTGEERHVRRGWP